MEDVLFLQMSFRTQLSNCRQQLKQKSIQKKIKQLQNSILNAVASYERFERVGELPEKIQDKLQPALANVPQNVFLRLNDLCKEYRKQLEVKDEILLSTMQIVHKLDNSICHVDLKLSPQELSQPQLHYLVQTQLYELLRQELITELQEERDFIKEYACYVLI